MSLPASVQSQRAPKALIGAAVLLLLAAALAALAKSGHVRRHAPIVLPADR